MTHINVTVNEEQNMYLEKMKEKGVSKSYLLRAALALWIKNEIKKQTRIKNKKYREMLKSLFKKESEL